MDQEVFNTIKGIREELSPTQKVNDPWLEENGITIFMKRDDLIHEQIQGNKWRKLLYNLKRAVQEDHHTLLTFGGAFSNHIAATAYACWSAGLDSIGVIRGEESSAENPTLTEARKREMELHFVSRTDYRKKTEKEFLANLKEKYGRFYLVPEGGANSEGVKGCTEILPEVKEEFDLVCCAMGTGTTVAGLALSLKEGQKLLGFPALKGGDFLMEDVERLIAESRLKPQSEICTQEASATLSLTEFQNSEFNFQLVTDYHFGGFAKMKPELLEFINGFVERTKVPLDPIYTGKMMFGIYDMIKTGQIKKGQTLLVVHSGGLQGWLGMEHRSLSPKK